MDTERIELEKLKKKVERGIRVVKHYEKAYLRLQSFYGTMMLIAGFSIITGIISTCMIIALIIVRLGE